MGRKQNLYDKYLLFSVWPMQEGALLVAVLFILLSANHGVL